MKRKEAKDIDPTSVRSKNNRLMLKAKCRSCGIIKIFHDFLKLGAISKDQHEKLYIMLKQTAGNVE